MCVFFRSSEPATFATLHHSSLVSVSSDRTGGQQYLLILAKLVELMASTTESRIHHGTVHIQKSIGQDNLVKQKLTSIVVLIATLPLNL